MNARDPHSAETAAGVSRPHESARAQVAGAATYIDDIPEVRGTLHAAPVCSPVAHGILRKLDGRDGFTQMKSLCANALGNLLADLGRYEEALARLGRAVELAQECGDADSHDRWLGNLACCLETLCRIDEARSACESALEGHRSRGDPAMIAYAPTSLASHLIRQMRLDQAKAHAEEAIGFSTTRKTLPTAPCAKRRRRDGDETRHLLRAPARALKDDPASVD